MTVKISSKAPDGDHNGLVSVAHELVNEPHQVHVVVALIDCHKTTIDHDNGEVVPTARVRSIEVILDPSDGTRVERMLRRAFERRTGQTVLPIDMEDDLRDALGGVVDDGGVAE